MSQPVEPQHVEVACLVVSHDGATWLPAVLDGLAAQSTPVDAVVAIDTGSRDASRDLIREALTGKLPLVVRELRADVGFPDAIADGLRTLTAEGLEPEWLWILHDDSRPEPDALAALLAAARERPDADILGPKLREWPSLKRLLEVGVTISGTGRRETGLERGEYDQGQHDDVVEVLAVNTAGMLVRRQALSDLGGFEVALPVFGNDIDLGWRAAANGRTTLVVPSAVVFHAEAAHRGVRSTALTGRHTHFQERRAALFTLLVNARRASLPFQAVRLVLGSLLRVLGLLCTRAVGEALDELAAAISIFRHPGALRRARKERAVVLERTRGADGLDTDRVRRLLAPWWLPYRHGIDFVSDLVAAATNQAADVAERRRLAAAERDAAVAPVPARHRDEDDDEYADSGLLVRFFTSPVALATAAAVIALLIGVREVAGGIAGGALSPTPDGVGAWWRLHLEATHPIGFGSQIPAPPYVLGLALIAIPFGPALSMALLMALAPPFALWGAWRFLRVVSRLVTERGAPRWLLMWGSLVWALVPLAAGAWGGGRWGIVVAAAVLPWLAHAALGFADPDASHRARAGWRTGLLLALVTAVAPSAWLILAVLVGVLLFLATRLVPREARDRSVWRPPVGALVVPLVLLLPWWLPALLEGAVVSTVMDIGRWPTPALSGLDLLTGRLADLGAPPWLGLVVPALALLALIPGATRIPVLVCWLVAAVTAVVAVPLALISLDLPDGSSQQAGLGAALLILHGAWVTAALIGGLGLHHLGDQRRPVQAGVVVAALVGVVTPLVALVWFAGWNGEDLAEPDTGKVPVYVAQRAELADENGVLVLHGSIADGIGFEIRRGDGPSVGEDEIAALTPENPATTELVTELVTAPAPDAVEALAAHGIHYIVLTAPTDGAVAASLDATSGLEQASAERGTRAWQVATPPHLPAPATPWLRWLLLAVQAAGIVVVAVAALPTMRRRRDG